MKFKFSTISAFFVGFWSFFGFYIMALLPNDFFRIYMIFSAFSFNVMFVLFLVYLFAYIKKKWNFTIIADVEFVDDGQGKRTITIGSDDVFTQGIIIPYAASSVLFVIYYWFIL